MVRTCFWDMWDWGPVNGDAENVGVENAGAKSVEIYHCFNIAGYTSALYGSIFDLYHHNTT